MSEGKLYERRAEGSGEGDNTMEHNENDLLSDRQSSTWIPVTPAKCFSTSRPPSTSPSPSSFITSSSDSTVAVNLREKSTTKYAKFYTRTRFKKTKISASSTTVDQPPEQKSSTVFPYDETSSVKGGDDDIVCTIYDNSENNQFQDVDHPLIASQESGNSEIRIPQKYSPVSYTDLRMTLIVDLRMYDYETAYCQENRQDDVIYSDIIDVEENIQDDEDDVISKLDVRDLNNKLGDTSESRKGSGSTKKPKRKRHRPKVVVEGNTPKKTPQQQLNTPNIVKPNEFRIRKRKYARESLADYSSCDENESDSRNRKRGRKARRVLNFNLGEHAREESDMITDFQSDLQVDESRTDENFKKRKQSECHFTKKYKGRRGKRRRRLNTFFMREPILFHVPTRRKRVRSFTRHRRTKYSRGAKKLKVKGRLEIEDSWSIAESREGSNSWHGALVPFRHNKDSAIVPYRKPSSKKKISGKVDLDTETVRKWNQLMNIEDGKTKEDKGKTKEEKDEEETENWWKRERELFRGRQESFSRRMHDILGDRRFKPWKGSVVDSVVGVFLTQNVSDILSSSAYMTLASRFPLPSSSYDDPELICSKDTQYYIQEPEPETSIGFGIEEEHLAEKEDMLEVEHGAEHHTIEVSSNVFHPPIDFSSNLIEQFYDSIGQNKETTSTEEGQKLKKENIAGPRKQKNTESKKKTSEDWEAMRRMYCNVQQRCKDQMDSVDWEAVRCADVDVIAEAIKERGQQNNIAERIKLFLNRVYELHNCIDLEWLRDAPHDKVKEYLLQIYGLGLKSVECIRLLSLKHNAFPVDINVCRIAVRLGWVPLQTLPGELQIHDLEEYPMIDTVQKYLWPRLCDLDQPTLYELHYQMITFGKVFCTKLNPNCVSCPLKGECKHYASAVASKRLKLQGPSEEGTVDSKVQDVADRDPQETRLLPESEYQANDCEPIIELPPSPGPQSTTTPTNYTELDTGDLYGDIEDFPTIKLQERQYNVEDLENFMEMNNNILEEDSRALVALPEEAKSIPARKLKHVTRLRTEHLAYILPDNHSLLEGFERREPDDICPYLLVIWSPGETPYSTEPPKKTCNSKESELCNDLKCYSCNNIREQGAGVVRGTILIPCRTANRGRFPLNGTYFQVNEVFADHETSKNPISVPRCSIATLSTTTVCFGTSATSIFKALDLPGITKCFLHGYVCVRGYERSYRAPRPLLLRFHHSPATTTKMGKRKKKENED